MARLLTLGPIALPTMLGPVSEAIGDDLDTVGAGVVPGDRRPRAFPITIPVHGDTTDGALRFETGLKLRRQLRALVENSPARLQGLYLAFTPDSEQNCWLLIGGADLKDANGGISLADFTLELSGCYRVANRRTHRPARRLEVTDRRLITTARDYLGTIFSTDFAAVTPAAVHVLGVGITDPESGGQPVATSTRGGKDGAVVIVSGRADGECISYEQAEADEYKAICRALDRRGSVVEANWQDIYGPDQPVTVGEIPVLDNSVCRVVPDVATGNMDIQFWGGSSWLTYATTIPPASSSGFSGRIVEWTTERVVLQVTALVSTTSRVQTYVTLQRGWLGPRIETYHQNTSGVGVATSIGVHSKSTGDSTLQRSSGTVAIVSGTSIGTFVGLQPWAVLLGPGTDTAVHLSVLDDAINLRGSILASREGVLLEATGYVAVMITTGARATGSSDAAASAAINLYDQQAVPELVARA
jgi:hypothetical protein